MVAGGLAYDLSALLQAPSPRRWPTGNAVLEKMSGGLEAGTVWAVTGPPGAGVTSLCATIAAGAAHAGADVIVCNGHVPSRAMARRLASLTNERGAPSAEARLRVASWYPAIAEPPDGTAPWEQADVVVLDTWDETWHAAPWPATLSELVRSLRWLRYIARAHHTVLVMTARTPAQLGDDVLGMLGDAFDDVADVRVHLHRDPSGTLAHMWSRDGRAWSARVVTASSGGVTLVRDSEDDGAPQFTHRQAPRQH